MSDDVIVNGFKNWISSTGVNWSGIDFDWENDYADDCSDAINKIGSALRSAGFTTTVAPTSYQFNPGAMHGWKTLNPNSVDAVMPQWYEGGCAGTNTCPCWGSHPDYVSGCPGFATDTEG